jgi:glycosyltransferase involved in cell wall biosynthesis
VTGADAGINKKAKRILFLAYRDSRNPFVGGGDIYINELAKGCVKRGHSVTFISSRFPGSKKEESVDGVRVIRLGSAFNMFFLLLFYYFRYLRGNFDVVVEDVLSGPRIPFLGSLFIKEKLIGIIFQRQKELFELQFSRPIAFVMSSVERLLVLVYSRKKIIVDSLRVKHDLRAIGYSLGKLTVIYPGLNDSLFADSIILPFDKRKKQILCLTKLRRYKLVEDAIRAIDILRKSIPDSHLVIAGRTNEMDPGYEDELRILVKDLNLSSNVSFIMDENVEEKAALLATSRVLILPSALEGFGIVVIEANVYGTPVVASNGVPADAANNGYNAIVVKRNDIQGYSNALLLLLSNRELWERMSCNSREWATHFKWSYGVDNLLALIENQC